MRDSQISFLAAKLAEQLKQPTTTTSGSSTISSTPGTGGGTSGFLWGAVAASALFLAAPLFRSVVRQAVKGGLRLGMYAKEMASTAKEELEDITAEAKAELFRNGGGDKDADQ